MSGHGTRWWTVVTWKLFRQNGPTYTARTLSYREWWLGRGRNCLHAISWQGKMGAITFCTLWIFSTFSERFYVRKRPVTESKGNAKNVLWIFSVGVLFKTPKDLKDRIIKDEYLFSWINVHDFIYTHKGKKKDRKKNKKENDIRSILLVKRHEYFRSDLNWFKSHVFWVTHKVWHRARTVRKLKRWRTHR